MAVGTGGTVTSSALDLAPLAERWTGGKWAVLTVPDPAPAGDIAELNSVSCTSATNCMAVGDYMRPGRHDRHDRGGAVERHDLDGPDHAQSSHVQRARVGVVHARPVHCVAVGASSATATGAVSPLTEVWNGSTWTVVTAPK